MYPNDWVESVTAYLALSISRFLDYCNTNAQWKLDRATINHSFVRFAIPISWDFAEANPMSTSGGGFKLCYERICSALDSYALWNVRAPMPVIRRESALQWDGQARDLVLTDPPYYDAIPYAHLSDFFHVWLRRTLAGLSPEYDCAFSSPLTPKWDYVNQDGELIDDASRFGGDKAKSKAAYEEGMACAFQACHRALTPGGRLVIVFAHKQPDAWETLVSAIIRAGFVVDGSWPIQTEQAARMRAQSSAALASSVWLVCKKRPEAARPGWDNRVLDEMRANIATGLRDFWDAGIRGPDFVWAATGPALEAYSKYPVVKKANEPGQVMSVSEFLRHVRRIVVDFVVGRVLTGDGDQETVSGLDDVTTYYLLHRNDFGMDEAPVGPCILYAVSCGLRDSDLANAYDILVRKGGPAAEEVEDEDDEEDEDGGDEEGEPVAETGGGGKVKLKPWSQRKRPAMGYDASGRPAPLIDQVHRLMHLWKAGDVAKVDEYLDARGLRRNVLFHHLLQALIELARAGGDERALLESVSNHIAARGVSLQPALISAQTGEE